MKDKIIIDEKILKILKKNMINNLLNYMTDEQRKEMFEFIGKYYNLKTGEVRNASTKRA